MSKIKLHIDELTKKVTGFTTFPIDKELDDYLVDIEIPDLLISSMQNNDIYFIDGELVTKGKKPEEHHNKIDNLQEQISIIKNNMNMNKLMETAFSNEKGIEDIPKMYRSLKIEMEELEETRNQLIHEHEKATTEYFKQYNKELDDSVDNKYHSSICLLIKDENEYLIEWIKWHLNIGIEHFYIYDNGSEIPVSETIKELSKEESKKITVVDWSGSHEHMQHDCYNHCLNMYGEESTWIAFLDSDEFFRLTGDVVDINTLLADYEDYGSFYTHWLMYNANGKEVKEDLPVRERFTALTNDRDESSFGKLFVKPTRVKKMFTHHAILRKGSETVDEKYCALMEELCKPSYNRIVIDHYYTKSYEEWIKKMERGSCDPDYRRKYDEFFRFNPDMVYLYDENFQSEQTYEEGSD